MEELSKELLIKLQKEIENSIEKLDLKEAERKLEELQKESMNPELWDDQEHARSIMAEIEEIRSRIEKSNKLSEGINTLIELFEAVDATGRASLQQEYETLFKDYSDFRKYLFLSGKYDKNHAILSIHAGQGGVEAQDWAQMLLRMYTRYCERKGWKTSVEMMVMGNEGGISSVTLFIEGLYAFGLLKMEKGTHRLVRLSPFNAQNLRQTSFAGVEVTPIINETDTDIVIHDEDIEFKAVHAGGPGGQGVNTSSSAVQIKHIPTGLTAHCSERRSQAENRKSAMQILKAKLWEIEEEKRNAELQKIKGVHKQASWGNQIRNYVLHPYKLVKDLRTGVESSNPDAILDGDLNQFIDEEIKLGRIQEVS